MGSGSEDRTPLLYSTKGSQSAPPPPYSTESTGSSSCSHDYSTTHQLNASAQPFIPQSSSAEPSPFYSHPHHHAIRHPAGPSPFALLPHPITHPTTHLYASADVRARRRFLSALFWGCLLYLALSALAMEAARDGEEWGREVSKGWKRVKNEARRWLRERAEEREGRRALASDLLPSHMRAEPAATTSALGTSSTPAAQGLEGVD